MNYNCLRHSDQTITHFCSNILCQHFMTFYCIKCNMNDCFNSYHLQGIDYLPYFITKLTLPNYDNKQLEYCIQQMEKVINNYQIVQDIVIKQYDDAINYMLDYIRERSQSFKNEIVEQIVQQKQFMQEKLFAFRSMIEIHYGNYSNSFQQVQNIFVGKCDTNLEEYYKKANYSQLQEYYKTLLRLQPEIDSLLAENTLSLTKEQSLLESLNENLYKQIEPKINENCDSCLTLLWRKYYHLTYNVNFFDQQSQNSIVQSEMVENIQISRSTSQAYSVFSEIEHIIAMGQQLNQGSTLKLKSQTYGYSKHNLSNLGQFQFKQQPLDQNIPQFLSYCILTIKNQNIIITAGDGNQLFIWKKDSSHWKVESILQLDVSYIQCIEIVYNPFLSESRNSRQSFANLKVLLNPIIAIGGGNTLYLLQYDMLSCKLSIQCRYNIKEQKEHEIHMILGCQLMGSYNYLIVGLERGTMILFNYIISIDNTFTLRIEQIIKHHKDCITSADIIGDQTFGIASNDRSVSIWNFYQNKMKLLPIKMNRFWEDIPCIRQIYNNSFITFDTSFNIIQWLLDPMQQKVQMINNISSTKQKIEIHEAIIINNPDNQQDFCILLLTKQQQDFSIIILDRYLQTVQIEKLPQQFYSLLSIPRKKNPQYITNYKFRISHDSISNKIFGSFADQKQSQDHQDSSNQQSFTQQQKNTQFRQVNIVAISNNKTNQQFLEFEYLIGNE